MSIAALLGLDLNSKLKSKLKTFSELKEEYGIDAIYRTSKVHRFSKKSALEGIPTSRKTNRPYTDYNSKVDGLQPIWFTPTITASIMYCNDNQPSDEDRIKNCITYKYIPRDHSLIKNKKLLFLDLTGGKRSYFRETYGLDRDLIEPIYDDILNDHENDIFTEDHVKQIIIDNEDYSVPVKKLKDAYGYGNGNRVSSHTVDEFFTLEMFHLLVDEYELEKVFNCVFMGYFHASVVSSNDSDFDSEFAIPWRNSINKNYIDFAGVAAIGRTLVSTKEKRTRSRSRSRSKSKSKSKSGTRKIQRVE